MADDSRLKNSFIAISRRESFNFDEIQCAESNFGTKNGHTVINKHKNFKMADSRHIENRIFFYISTSYCPIDAIFGMYK